jgi:ketosteroid isomerase-like protein
MSANLDLVRSIYATRERGDLDWWAHPDIEVVSVDGPQPGTWRGVDGLAEALRTWRDAWEDFRAEPEAFRALGDGRVLVMIRRSGRGRASGLELRELRTDGAAVFHVVAGKVTRVVNYFDRDRALADLGLRE